MVISLPLAVSSAPTPPQTFDNLLPEIVILLLLAFLFVSVVSAAEYHGNRQSGIYHGPQCRYYFFKNCTAKAISPAGFSPTSRSIVK